MQVLISSCSAVWCNIIISLIFSIQIWIFPESKAPSPINLVKQTTKTFPKMRSVTVNDGFQIRWLTTAGFLHGRHKLAKTSDKRTCIPNKRAAADTRSRPCGTGIGLPCITMMTIIIIIIIIYFIKLLYHELVLKIKLQWQMNYIANIPVSLSANGTIHIMFNQSINYLTLPLNPMSNVKDVATQNQIIIIIIMVHTRAQASVWIGRCHSVVEPSSTHRLRSYSK